MNVFVSSYCPTEAAQMLADKHVVKMTLESAQLLSTYCREHLGRDDDGLYRSTHRNHPCSVAMRDNPRYLAWTIEHAFALSDEFTHRYGRVHKSLAVIQQCVDIIRDSGVLDGVSACALDAPKCVLPEHRRICCVVDAYRATLKHKYCHDFAGRWTRRPPPHWFS